MFSQTSPDPSHRSLRSRAIDLGVIAVAGVFFVNIVIGSEREDDEMLFLAAELGVRIEPVVTYSAIVPPGE